MDTNFSPILLVFLCIAALVAADGGKVVGSNPLYRDEEHMRIKRADVSRIKHLYNEERINELNKMERDAMLDKHNEFRSSVNPEANNMQYMVSILSKMMWSSGRNRNLVTTGFRSFISFGSL